MKYCKHCGAQVRDEAIFCPSCGCSTESQPPAKSNETSEGLRIAAKIFMIISCCLTGLFLIPLAWKIPMTVRYGRSIDKSGLPVGTGFKICSLLFVSMVAGILMLCDNEAWFQNNANTNSLILGVEKKISRCMRRIACTLFFKNNAACRCVFASFLRKGRSIVLARSPLFLRHKTAAAAIFDNFAKI